ncbi:MAG: tRNA (adenosine(37)-N6)-threonylcarbamoyltransferase complex transferase subunit TsaD [Candidatus Sungiibacteriota bacterium]|uniref:tRNA N6-adenosine threonylcarbamoyltransferase n=1 Tax=Candidatus Sungiibacteriota bacterium TaxID=2750080 RepID=A0A7T5RKD9_9BACT|nr:MAG: tRNA (adenosine(37)-N6)-threonylcarbamoyltransferase complex transferase subunit TsaD [Candidatus Sungbacteria bacterium]
MKRILAIETSCDETAIAIAEFFGPKRKPQIRVLSNIISSQVKIHEKFGGVVPNLAKREHQRSLVPTLLQALSEAGRKDLRFKIYDLRKTPKQKIPKSKVLNLKSVLAREPELFKQFNKRIVPLVSPKIDAIAVTYGPGLAPALWVGVNFARALAYLWGKPLIPVNHMAGHLYSAFLQKSGGLQAIKFPALALLVSGGHTELVLVGGGGKFKILGETLDDAAGEAFDKVARLLGLGYPGGPEISRLADRLKSDFDGFEVGLQRIKLPRPMTNSKDYNFSFSGLKTAVFYLVRDLGVKRAKKLRPFIAKEFQDAVVDVLVKKTIRAAKEYKAKTVLLGGGVAANKLLRRRLIRTVARELSNTECLTVPLGLSGDNALIIALAAFFAGKKKAPSKIGADANAKL